MSLSKMQIRLVAFALCFTLVFTSVFAPIRSKALVPALPGVAVAAYNVVKWPAMIYSVLKNVEAAGNAFDSIFGSSVYEFLKENFSDEDSYSDYVSSLPTPILNSSDVGYHLDFNLSSENIDAYQELLDNGKLLELEIDENILSYVLGTYTSSRLGNYYWNQPEVSFVSPEFYISSSDRFELSTEPFYTYSRETTNSNYIYACRVQKYADGTWVDCGQVEVDPGESEDFVTYYKEFYPLASVSVELVGGYKYRIILDFKLKSDIGDGAGTFYGYQRGIFLEGCNLISATNTPTTPAYTRPASTFESITNWNLTDNSTKYYIGTLDANGDVTNYYHLDVFDESSMIIEHPATGQTWNCVSWEYDYSTRSYDCITENGEAISVTYGDEYITFVYPKDGVYYRDLYYYVEVVYDDDTEDVCDHSFTSTTTSSPSCVDSGWRTYSCSLCDYVYSDPLPATGHDYSVIESVETVFADNGDILSVGYTLYGCQNCDASYIAYDGTGQPGGSVEDESWFSWLGSLFKTLLSSIVNGLAAGLEWVIEEVLVTTVGWIVRAVEWVFGLFDGKHLSTLFNWFSFEHEAWVNEFSDPTAFMN